MFATLYVTVGAFCETTREAQTLLGPMMILLSLPMVFMSQAITHPDAPLAGDAVVDPDLHAVHDGRARGVSDPPLWQVAGTAALMAATTAIELWVAGPGVQVRRAGDGPLRDQDLLGEPRPANRASSPACL